MKYYIIAGEASGDLHGSNLMKGLKASDSSAEFRFWGGDLMAAEGGTLVRHYKETAVVGFVEVLMSLDKITKNLRLCKKDLLDYKPDVLILIDYPGFNFRIAKFAKENNIIVFYYISPKVWAWKESRVKNLKRDVDRLFIIFPFEIEYFKKWGINAIYNGNPLLDSTAGHPVHKESEHEFRKRNNLNEKPIIGLLAGSRVMEINYLLPRMVKIEQNFPDYQFLLAGAPSIEKSIYNKHLKSSNIKLLTGETYGILKHSKATVLSSGTASLEAALLDAPQVVCYGGNEISYRIAKLLVKVKFISLVNLILDRPVVKELIQHECTPDKITKELKKLLGKGQREKLVKKYSKLRDLLGGEGASVKVAKSMIEEYNKIVDSRRFTKVIDTPIGLLKLICDKDSLTEVTYLQSKNNNLHNDNHPVLTEAEKQFMEYFANQRKSFDLPVKPDGTEFQRKVWDELCKIPYGKVRSYGEVAKLIGTKDANRAVGMACKMNPLLIVVPCHRVLGAHNKLTGFNIGIDKQSFLLEHEKAYQSEEQNLFN